MATTLADEKQNQPQIRFGLIVACILLDVIPALAAEGVDGDTSVCCPAWERREDREGIKDAGLVCGGDGVTSEADRTRRSMLRPLQ
ncbi:Os08g0351400 [Oryza sativa Japonica Group]|uniref:Os08g0351400 protein n=2 Tax=Oryza sativa subsp. japonica TaxID=39947 RepID=A3BSB6_ORYSJ|nr:hypothetical protein OsJ_27026 [Oryza sativa Japonica Group]BAT05059.1 Os08g0351400 [Oryza sativa Japonica Group]